jgi:hypothetical protein
VRAQFNAMPPVAAVRRAWTDPGNNPRWHKTSQRMVRAYMPLLAEALDRLAASPPYGARVEHVKRRLLEFARTAGPTAGVAYTEAVRIIREELG